MKTYFSSSRNPINSETESENFRRVETGKNAKILPIFEPI